jgi:putative glutamine amidotransferase
VAPLVALPAYPIAPQRVERWADAGVAVPEPYVAAVQRAGGQEAILGPRPITLAEAHDLLAHFAGLILLGGNDLDARTYGQAPHPSVYGVSAVRDAFEAELCRAALDRDLPLLAVCRGAQLLNVVRGGSLHQHITEDFPGHGKPGVEGGQEIHAVELLPGTLVASVVGASPVMASCHHHQAIDALGAGLVVSARAPDGIVEGLELPGSRWVVAVQWHPEDTAGDDPAQQRLFDAFVAECARDAV